MRDIDTDYYQPIRDQAGQSRAVIVFDTGWFIKSAQIDLTAFGNGRPTPNGLTPLLEIFPYLAKRGFVNLCSERVSWKAAGVVHTGENVGRFYSGPSKFDATNRVLYSFFQKAVHEEWLTILPALRCRTEYDRLLQNVIACASDRGHSKIGHTHSRTGKTHSNRNPKDLSNTFFNNMVRGQISALHQHPNASENSTANMIGDIGLLPCRLFYISSDTQALAMMRRAGAISLHTLNFIEILQQQKILPQLGLKDGHEDIIPLCSSVVFVSHTYDPAVRTAALEKSARSIASFVECLGKINENAAPEDAGAEDGATATRETALDRFKGRYGDFILAKK